MRVASYLLVWINLIPESFSNKTKIGLYITVPIGPRPQSDPVSWCIATIVYICISSYCIASYRIGCAVRMLAVILTTRSIFSRSCFLMIIISGALRFEKDQRNEVETGNEVALPRCQPRRRSNSRRTVLIANNANNANLKVMRLLSP